MPGGRFRRSVSAVDDSVLEAFQRRDPDAVRALYREYGKLVYAVAHRVLGRHDLAEDAVQQTFVRAWQASDRIDVDRDPAPWLATIAKRVAIDIHRSGARRPAVALTAVSPNDGAVVNGDVEVAPRASEARRAVGTLAGANRMNDQTPEEQRRALIAGDRTDIDPGDAEEIAMFADLLADPSTWAEPTAGLEDAVVQ